MNTIDTMTREEWANALREWAAEADCVTITAEMARRIAWWLHAMGPSQH